MTKYCYLPIITSSVSHLDSGSMALLAAYLKATYEKNKLEFRRNIPWSLPSYLEDDYVTNGLEHKGRRESVKYDA